MGLSEGISPVLVKEQLDRIATSSGFRQSERMRRFLAFCVEAALNGETPKEYAVGAAVFDRKQDYDPRVDPIVRVEARRLRAKLEQYYSGNGAGDEIVIELPKGCYTAVLRRGQPKVIEALTTPSIVILPFVNLSASPGDEYFSDGLTEELIHRLTRAPGLRVLAWPSASRLRGRDEDLRGIRDQLGVDLALRGSVRRSGGRVRITAQLVDAASGQFRWSESYDRDMSDLLAIQEEIAAAIVSTLKLALSSPSRPGRADVESHNLCLKGRYLAGRRTLDSIRKSVACFEQAAAIDPESATAYAGLADGCILMAEYGGLPPAPTMERARKAAQKALELDPFSAEAYTSLAMIRSYLDWNWTEAGELYRKALDLNPSYARARHWYGLDYLGVLGRWDEAAAELEIARQLDPLSAIILEGGAHLHLFRREYELALDVLRSVLELDPSFYKAYTAIGRVYALQGRYREALEMFNRGRAAGGDVPSILAATGQVLGLLGERERALEYLGLLRGLSGETYIPMACFAIVHLGLGEHETVLSFLERAADQRESSVVFLKVHPLYDPLRSEPRFLSLLRRAGFLP